MCHLILKLNSLTGLGNFLTTVLYLSLAISWKVEIISYTQSEHLIASGKLEKLKNEASLVQDVYLILILQINKGTLKQTDVTEILKQYDIFYCKDMYAN